MEGDRIMSEAKGRLFDRPVFQTRVTSANIRPREMLLGYILGPFGGLITSQVFVVYLNTYWTDVLGLGATAGGFLTVFPLLSALFIVLGNFVAGRLIDRTLTAQGKARPYLLLSAVLLAAASILVYAVPAGNTTVQLVWIVVSYNLYYAVAYPLYSVSNSLMLPLSTRNEKQRGMLSVVVNIATLGASSFATLVMPLFVPYIGIHRQRWLLVMCALGLFTLVAVVIQYYFTRERITEEGMKLRIKEAAVPLKTQLRAVLSEKYWWIVIVFYLLFQFAGTMQNFSMIYYCNYILGTYNDGFTQSVLGIVTGIPLGAGMLFAWPLAKKFGKRNSIVAGLLISALGCLVALLAPRSWLWVVVGLCVKCLGAAPAVYVMMALFADVLDHIEARHGFRCDGLSMSLYSIIMSLMLSVCQGVFNGLIRGSGYLPPTQAAGAALQNAATQNVFIWCYLGVMMIAYALCALLLLGLRVESKIEADHRIILERQKAAVLAAGGQWIEPAERLRMEQAQADEKAEQARREELRLRCERKGLSFAQEEQKYQAKQQAAREKKARKSKPV